MKLNRQHLGFILFLIPSFAYADMVWPALYFVNRYALLAIPIGLVTEYLIVKRALKTSPRKSFFLTLSMNVISAIVGSILIAAAGILWEIFPGMIISKYFNTGTFNPVTWLATLVIAILITTYIEYGFVRLVAKETLQKGVLKAFFVANTLSVLIAFISILIFPIRD